MESHRTVTAGRLRRLSEELVDEGLGLVELMADPGPVLEELDYAMRPPRHERRVPTYGSFVDMGRPPEEWRDETGLNVLWNPTRRAAEEVRRYSDGLSAWTARSGPAIDAVMVFDRAAGSERDLVVLAHAADATVVQRHPSGVVRVVGDFGVIRWDGVEWHLEPPLSSWLERASCGLDSEEADVLESLLRFAVHDLGARGIGSLLVYRPRDAVVDSFEQRIAQPPPLDISNPSALGPLHHVLTQIDGAAVFDSSGLLRHLGVRLVPSAESEADVEPLRGTRHTAARRFSFDDPQAIVIAVSEDGPVTVLRNGKIIGGSGIGIGESPVVRPRT